MATMLQLAIDTLTPQEALALVEHVHPYIDSIEASTPSIKCFGLETLMRFHQVAPDKLLVADMKIMDAGSYEAAIAFDAGALFNQAGAVASQFAYLPRPCRGTKLGRRSPCWSKSAIHSASLTSVFLPGTAFKCWALTTITSQVSF